ncbi:hypothetical protein ERO13_A07G039100v2 [Gossypium hirsutum]|nr:hypothetical protein ERO13_A07G039100v2 [Gossypium hirsutum]
MRRKKSRAKRRVARSNEEDTAGVDDEPGASKDAVEAAEEAGIQSEKDVNQEIDCFKEEFEEVENVVIAVMEMDSIIQQNSGDVVQIESNFTDGSIRKNDLCSEVNGVGESEKSDNLDVSVECSKFEEVIEDGTVRGQNLTSNIQVMDVDSGSGIVNGEEAKDHENSEQKSLEEEPSSARIAVMTLDGQTNGGYNNKDGNDREKEEESRGGWEQNEDIAVTDVNEGSQVVDHDSPTKQKKEKQLEIHVGGLHKEIVEKDLFEIFGKFGEVQSARIVRHRTTKKSKGFAFIQYATTEQAKKVLSDLKHGIEVKGKLAKLSISHDRDVLYLGRICRTWTKEDVLGKLKGYGIENIDEIQVPNDPKDDRKIKGFAFLRFNTFSDAKAALHRLRKPDAAFGNARGAKIAFARTPMHPREKVRLQVKTIYVEGIPKSWDVHKLKEICEQYAETKKVKISRNLSNKGKDFGFISFTTRGGAVACVEGMNKLRYGGNVKVKAYIARPLVQTRLQKSSCLGLKFSKRHRNSDWLKLKGHARSKGVKKESDVRAATVIYKSKIWGTKEKPAAAVYKNNQDPLNSKHTIEGKRNEQQGIAPESHDAEDGLSTKPKKTDFKRNNRKRQRNLMHSKRSSNKPEGSVLMRERNHMHSKRSSNKPEGSVLMRERNHMHSKRSSNKPEGSVLKRERNHLHSKRSSNKREGTSQGRHIRPSRGSKSRSYVRKGHGRGADSIAYRIPIKEAYAPSTSGYPGSAHGAISGSKRPSSYMESHAGFAQPVKHNDQYLTECIAPAFHHQRQAYAGYLKLDHYERQPPAKYFKPAIGNDALPHAGFLESSFRKQSFDGARRIAEYSGPDNQGPVHGSGSAYSRPYVPNNLSYAGYEGNSNGGGYHGFRRAYTARQAHY